MDCLRATGASMTTLAFEVNCGPGRKGTRPESLEDGPNVPHGVGEFLQDDFARGRKRAAEVVIAQGSVHGPDKNLGYPGALAVVQV